MTIRKTLLFVLFLYGGGQVMATKDDKEADKEAYDKMYDDVLEVYNKDKSQRCSEIAEQLSPSGWFISRKKKKKVYDLAYRACLNVRYNDEKYGGFF